MNTKFSPLEIIGLILLVIIGINLLQFFTGLVFGLVKFILPFAIIAGVWYYFSNQKKHS